MVLLALISFSAADLLEVESARADTAKGSPIHTSGDLQLWHRKENRVELFGHAIVSQPGETLSADYVSLDMANRVLDAKGNCVYVVTGSVIYGEEMHFNLDTRTGTIVSGRVSNERFTLSGERINKLGEGRFQTHQGEYTTCTDCPGSWSFLAEDVDMQIEGYAYMSGVTGRVGDVPAFWLPYLIVPMKNRRQTGLLFPTFQPAGPNGFAFVLPYFWAINESSDMTLGLGYYADRGERVEWEGRYMLAPRSGGTANFNYLHDNSFTDTAGGSLGRNRWSLNIAQSHELPFGITEKLKILEVSDNLYPIKVGDPIRPGDVVSGGELNLASSLSFAYAHPDFSAYVAARRFRTLINTNQDPELQTTQFDPRTVQAMPTAALTTRDRQIFDSPAVFGVTLGVSNFTRSRDAFDYDFSQVPYGRNPTVSDPPFSAGIDPETGYNVNPIRKATRVSLSPTLYTTLRPLDRVSLIPSVRYFNYFYSFPETSGFSVPNLHRSYVLFQTDLSTQLEKIYEFMDEEDRATPRVKHLIRPLMTYSYIPPSLVSENPGNHPFIGQIKYATKRGIPGYYFDDYDIVPIDASPASTNYFTPLGNSLTFGLTTQLIRRNGAVDADSASYTKFFEASAGETINFRELQKDSDQQPLSRFFQTLDFSFGPFAYNHTYYYWPYLQGIRHQLTTTASYALERATHAGLFNFDRSISLTYNWLQQGVTDLSKGTHNLTSTLSYSISDYILPSFYSSVNLLPGQRLLAAGLSVQFQSPSRCWKFALAVPYRIENGLSYNVDFAFNLTGAGYGGVTDLATQTGVLK